MADNVDFPGPDDPQPAPAPVPEGDLPADFFDDLAEPSPVSPPPEPDPEPESPSAPPPPPAPARPSVPAPAPEEAPRAPIFPTVLGLLMVGLLIAAVVMSMMTPQKPAATTTSAPAPAAEAKGPPETSPAESLSKEVKDRVDGLAAQVKGLEAKLDRLPKPEPAPDLKPIQNRIDELAKSVAPVGALGEKVDKLDRRVGGLDDAVKSLKDETAALSGEVKKASEAAAAAPAARTERPAEDKGDESATALNRGVELFKAGKYQEAADAFKKLADGDPRDARVYYYAALTHGLTTGDWQNETPKIASKGAALEKAGSPRASEVDAAFADLTANLKPWLAYFRKGAR